MKWQRTGNQTWRNLALVDHDAAFLFLFTGSHAWNTKYHLEIEYKFYATVCRSQRSNGGTAIAMKKDIPHKRLIIRTILLSSSAGGLPGKKKNNIKKEVARKKSMLIKPHVLEWKRKSILQSIWWLQIDNWPNNCQPINSSRN